MAPHPPPWFIAVGASGGEGLSDIRDLLGALGPPANAVVMVVLHRPFDRPTRLREVLATATAWPVAVASDGQELTPGRCYIGDPAAHLTLIARSCGAVTPDPANTFRNRTVDLLFGSVAAVAQRRAVGIVLSGSLDDGSRGLAAIHEAGGKTMVIRHALRLSSGMPENAIGYDGPIDCIGSGEDLAASVRGLLDEPLAA